MASAKSTARNRLKAIGPAGKDHYGKILWKYSCKCGKIVIRVRTNVAHGATRSCGCLLKEKSAERCRARATHGMSESREFMCWKGMLKRCSNKNNKDFKHYGGRGIRVCNRWKKFENFYADMGPRPSKKHTIERIKNGRGYWPSNCKWSTMKEQLGNTRRNHWIRFNGQKMYLSQWSRKTGKKEPVIGLSRRGFAMRPFPQIGKNGNHPIVLAISCPSNPCSLSIILMTGRKSSAYSSYSTPSSG